MIKITREGYKHMTKWIRYWRRISVTFRRFPFFPATDRRKKSRNPPQQFIILQNSRRKKEATEKAFLYFFSFSFILFFLDFGFSVTHTAQTIFPTQFRYNQIWWRTELFFLSSFTRIFNSILKTWGNILFNFFSTSWCPSRFCLIAYKWFVHLCDFPWINCSCLFLFFHFYLFLLFRVFFFIFIYFNDFFFSIS